MPTVRLIIRILDAANALLAWAEIHAVMKGDGCLRASSPTTFIPLKPGMMAMLSIHWPDLNVQRRQPWAPEPMAVVMGEPITLTWPEGVILRVESDPEPMPAIAMGTHKISLPPSFLGVVVP